MSPNDNHILINNNTLKQYGACELRSDSDSTNTKSHFTKSLDCNKDDTEYPNFTLNAGSLDANCKQQALSGQFESNKHKQHHLHRENGAGQEKGANQSDDDDSSMKQLAQAAAEQEEETGVLHRMAKTIPCLGIIFALCASFFLGSAGMLVKMTHSIHGIQVAVCRATIQLAIYGIWISVRRGKFLPKRDELLPVMGRAFLGASSITCSYYALKLIPLGDATTIRFSLPIWTLIISYLVLNESCDIFKVGAVIVSISGVVLIAKPDDCIYLMHKLFFAFDLESASEFELNYKHYELIKSNSTPAFDPEATDIQLERYETLIASRCAQDASAGEDPDSLLMSVARSVLSSDGTTTTSEQLLPINYQQFEGCLLALSSSICLSLSLVALRLCKKTPAEITIFWLSIISIVIGSISLVSMNKWSLPDNLLDVMLIILNGLCGSIGQWFITSALKIEQSGIISLARTFDIEVAFLYSAFVLQEHIRATSIVGSCLVSLGVVAVLVPKWLKSRQRRLTVVAGESSRAASCQSENGTSSTKTTNGAESRLASSAVNEKHNERM